MLAEGVLGPCIRHKAHLVTMDAYKLREGRLVACNNGCKNMPPSWPGGYTRPYRPHPPMQPTKHHAFHNHSAHFPYPGYTIQV